MLRAARLRPQAAAGGPRGRQKAGLSAIRRRVPSASECCDPRRVHAGLRSGRKSRLTGRSMICAALTSPTRTAPIRPLRHHRRKAARFASIRRRSICSRDARDSHAHWSSSFADSRPSSSGFRHSHSFAAPAITSLATRTSGWTVLLLARIFRSRSFIRFTTRCQTSSSARTGAAAATREMEPIDRDGKSVC